MKFTLMLRIPGKYCTPLFFGCVAIFFQKFVWGGCAQSWAGEFHNSRTKMQTNLATDPKNSGVVMYKYDEVLIRDF